MNCTIRCVMWCIQLITLVCMGLVVSASGAEGGQVPLRLRYGESQNEGRVEIYHGFAWFTLCNETWNESIAKVVCRQLGFSGVERVVSTHDFDLSTCQFFPGFTCDGDEDSLAQCDEIDTGHEFCNEGAAVICQANSMDELERHLVRAIVHKLAYEKAREVLKDDLDERREETAMSAELLEEKEFE